MSDELCRSCKSRKISRVKYGLCTSCWAKKVRPHKRVIVDAERAIDVANALPQQYRREHHPWSHERRESWAK